MKKLLLTIDWKLNLGNIRRFLINKLSQYDNEFILSLPSNSTALYLIEKGIKELCYSSQIIENNNTTTTLLISKN